MPKTTHRSEVARKLLEPINAHENRAHGKSGLNVANATLRFSGHVRTSSKVDELKGKCKTQLMPIKPVAWNR